MRFHKFTILRGHVEDIQSATVEIRRGKKRRKKKKPQDENVMVCPVP